MDYFYIHFKCYLLSQFPPFQKPHYPILPPPGSMRVFIHPLCFHLTTLNFSTLGHQLSLPKMKDLVSHWCLTRQSSTTYTTRAMSTTGHILSQKGCGWVDALIPPLRALPGYRIFSFQIPYQHCRLLYYKCVNELQGSFHLRPLMFLNVRHAQPHILVCLKQYSSCATA